LVLYLAFICFHSANRVRVFPGANPGILPIASIMHSFHKLHIRHQANSIAASVRYPAFGVLLLPVFAGPAMPL